MISLRDGASVILCAFDSPSRNNASSRLLLYSSLFVLCVLASVGLIVAAFTAGAEPESLSKEACLATTSPQMPDDDNPVLAAALDTLHRAFAFGVMYGIVKYWHPIHSSLFNGM
mmetsp:Transcript_110001/g.173785  ORF Transcript_110001/g.173785 Transcript_110001/m.173785 type:complete len:114 (+) Transcript_110001:93-434(+)